LEASGVGTWTLDVGSGEVVWSDQLKRIFGVEPDADLTFDRIMTMMHPDDRSRAIEAMGRALAEGDDYDIENRTLSPNGEVRWIAGRGRAITGSDGRPTRMVGIGYDITARKRAEEALSASERRFRLLLEAAPDGIVIVDAEGRISHANRQIERLFGYAADDLRGQPIEILVPERERGHHAAHRAAYTAKPRLRAMGTQMQVCGRRADGTEFPAEVSLSPLQADEEQLVIAVVRDITARKAMEERLTLQATRDPLTGLINRARFLERVEEALAGGSVVAVLFLDLDGFKPVNDTIGHEAGDRLLVEVGRRLTTCVRQGDVVARLGGDEFTVLLEGTDVAQATAVAERMLAAIGQPVTLDDHRRQVAASIGIALGRPGRSKASALLREADVALYQAKAGGKNRVSVFAPGMGRRVRRRDRLSAELREAIASDALELHYQPQVDLTSGLLVGVEALVRWAHPSRGMTTPADFLPLAEETGSIVQLGEWVLREACRQLRRWRESVPAARSIVVGVNLSAQQLKLPDLTERITAILAAEGAVPADLALEVPERVLEEEMGTRATGLAALAGLGVRLTIDDFGSGWSALGHLRTVPIGGLKIDRSFVRGLERDPRTAAIVEAVTMLADRIGLRVIAEGIETADELRQARAAGCAFGQGFYFTPPVSAFRIGEMLACGTVFDVLNDDAPVPALWQAPGRRTVAS
jgi:diguanylate cyclase (GGDEF)-like protein/PAS domain S-box-containing protein